MTASYGKSRTDSLCSQIVSVDSPIPASGVPSENTHEIQGNRAASAVGAPLSVPSTLFSLVAFLWRCLYVPTIRHLNMETIAAVSVSARSVNHAMWLSPSFPLPPSLSQKISIVPRSGGALGFAYMPPPADGDERLLLFVDELRGQLAVLLGGRAAEDVCFGGRISTGAVDDIRRATDIAYKAVAEGWTAAEGGFSGGARTR